MTHDVDDAYLKGALEALLFVSDEPVSSVRLAVFLNTTPERTDALLAELSAEYEQGNRGMQLVEVAGGWRFFSHPAYHELIEKYVVSWDTRRMSQAALEALAVIAYHQPVTRAALNAIRGVSSEGVVSSLVEKGLVKEVGREKGARGAVLYGTTRAFLEKFGLKNIKELPPLEDFAPDEATRDVIRARLGGTVEQVQQGSEAEVREGSEPARAATDADLEDGIEDVDYGGDERIDDPGEMARILGASLTEKTGDVSASSLCAVAASLAENSDDGSAEDES